mmetsp:Transcript_1918/g.4474  ORF Transcript_1918/g.4474 Transcript_1918/m.4474 type:complete len:250 (+) Transcript_1918:3412-4161(+)
MSFKYSTAFFPPRPTSIRYFLLETGSSLSPYNSLAPDKLFPICFSLSIPISIAFLTASSVFQSEDEPRDSEANFSTGLTRLSNSRSFLSSSRITLSNWNTLNDGLSTSTGLLLTYKPKAASPQPGDTAPTRLANAVASSASFSREGGTRTLARKCAMDGRFWDNPLRVPSGSGELRTIVVACIDSGLLCQAGGMIDSYRCWARWDWIMPVCIAFKSVSKGNLPSASSLRRILCRLIPAKYSSLDASDGS